MVRCQSNCTYVFINIIRENFIEFHERNTNDPADKALGYTGIMRDVMRVLYKIDVIDLYISE